MVQGALVKGLESAGSLRGESEAEITAWVLRIMRNLSTDHARRRNRDPARLDPDLVESAVAEHPSPLDGVALKQAHEVLEERVDALPPMEQAVINLVLRYGFSTIEAAQLLGASPAAVRMAQMRALRKLKPI